LNDAFDVLAYDDMQTAVTTDNNGNRRFMTSIEYQETGNN